MLNITKTFDHIKQVYTKLYLYKTNLYNTFSIKILLLTYKIYLYVYLNIITKIYSCNNIKSRNQVPKVHKNIFMDIKLSLHKIKQQFSGSAKIRIRNSNKKIAQKN